VDQQRTHLNAGHSGVLRVSGMRPARATRIGMTLRACRHRGEDLTRQRRCSATADAATADGDDDDGDDDATMTITLMKKKHAGGAP
jgi:hypothetical protein